jgi:cytochrome P450
MPRVAMKAGKIGPYKIRKGALIMIAPWTMHRHVKYWDRPDTFDPDRFMPDGPGETTPGSYIPFGAGPHTCIGAGFAGVEAALILASLTRAFDFHLLDSEKIRPAARLTTRPAEQIMMRVTRHEAKASD